MTYKEGLDFSLTSEQYHAIPNVFSSSQLKDAFEDCELFHKKYILKTIERQELAAFDIGSYFHTAILEPEKVESECAVFEGVRRGKAWDEFRETNKGKAIVTPNEFKVAQGLIEAVRSSPIAMNRIKRGTPEVSGFLNLKVCGSEIYAPSFKVVHSKNGWVSAKAMPKSGVDILVKVRADLLAEDYILDLKSTSGNAKDPKTVKKKISEYHYDLSAALYLDVFSLITERVKSDFIWTFASKDYMNSRSYLASQTNIQIGRVKWAKAIRNLAECIENGWVFEDSMGILEPNYWEMEHLQEKAEDIL